MESLKIKTAESKVTGEVSQSHLLRGLTMRLIRFVNMLLATSSISSFTFAGNHQSKIEFFCNSEKTVFIIGDNSSNKKGFKKNSVNWGDLIEYSPAPKGESIQYRSGSKITTRNCGDLEIRFMSGFLNHNLQGQEGSVDFPVIELRKNGRVILSKTALETCQMNNTMTMNCPTGWANSIHVEK